MVKLDSGSAQTSESLLLNSKQEIPKRNSKNESEEHDLGEISQPIGDETSSMKTARKQTTSQTEQSYQDLLNKIKELEDKNMHYRRIECESRDREVRLKDEEIQKLLCER